METPIPEAVQQTIGFGLVAAMKRAEELNLPVKGAIVVLPLEVDGEQKFASAGADEFADLPSMLKALIDAVRSHRHRLDKDEKIAMLTELLLTAKAYGADIGMDVELMSMEESEERLREIAREMAGRSLH